MKQTLTEALRIAKRHLPNHPSQGKSWMHWAFVVVNGKIVEWGTNMRGTVPTHYGYEVKDDVDSPALLHAEVVAFRRASKLLGKRLKQFDIINIRLNRRGEPRMAAPCECCYPFLKELGCHKFYFTTEAGWGKLV